MSQPSRIVCISHDASLSGAPVLLLNLLRLLRDQGGFELHIVLKRSGPLEAAFRDVATVTVLKPAHYLRGGSLMARMLQAGHNRLQLLRAFRQCCRARVLLSNTITNGRLLRWLMRCGRPVITYVHELSAAAREHDLHGDVSLTLKYSRFFLYPSSAVQQMLLQDFSLPAGRMGPLRYYFPPASLPDLNAKAAARGHWAERYGLDPAHCWVVGMGTASLRKGIDYFLSIAREVIARNNRVSFIWIGGFDSAETERAVERGRDGIPAGRLLMTGPQEHEPGKLLPFDCFLLSSREDPYPLVVLEAAACGLPTCCFIGSGGITDFVNPETGWLVDDFSTTRMAELLAGLAAEPALLAARGARARQQVQDMHFHPALILEQFRTALAQTLQ